jgi:hypothetical protein
MFSLAGHGHVGNGELAYRLRLHCVLRGVGCRRRDCLREAQYLLHKPLQHAQISINRPRQALKEHPRPTDRRDGNGSEIDEFDHSGLHSLTPKRADQLEVALPPTEFAG